MSISREELLHLARLARLEIDGTELDALRTDLEAILAYAERLEDVTALPGRDDPAPTALRADEVQPGLPPGEATRPAPSASGGLFRVPPVLGGEEA